MKSIGHTLKKHKNRHKAGYAARSGLTKRPCTVRLSSLPEDYSVLNSHLQIVKNATQKIGVHYTFIVRRSPYNVNFPRMAASYSQVERYMKIEIRPGSRWRNALDRPGKRP